MAMDKCSAYSSLQPDSKVKSAAWHTSWRPPGTDRLSSRWPKLNSRIWLVPYSCSGYLYYIIIIIITAVMWPTADRLIGRTPLKRSIMVSKQYNTAWGPIFLVVPCPKNCTLIADVMYCQVFCCFWSVMLLVVRVSNAHVGQLCFIAVMIGNAITFGFPNLLSSAPRLFALQAGFILLWLVRLCNV